MLAEGCFGSLQMRGMVVTISLRQHLDRHAKESGRLPEIDPRLHKPRRCSVPQDVGSNVIAQSGISHDVAEGFVDARNGRAVPLHSKPLGPAFPAPQMREQAGRQRDRRLSLFCFAATCRPPIEYAIGQINPATPLCRLECSPADCTRSGTCIERNQNESSNVLPGTPISQLALLYLVVSPRRADQF